MIKMEIEIEDRPDGALFLNARVRELISTENERWVAQIIAVAIGRIGTLIGDQSFSFKAGGVGPGVEQAERISEMVRTFGKEREG